MTEAALDRRRFLLLAGLVAAAGLNACLASGSSRQANAVPAIGYLSTGSASSGGQAAYRAAFLEGLADLGYLEERTISIEWRFLSDHAGGNADLPQLAADLVARNVQVIVTSSTPAVLAAASATKSIPIVSGGPSRGLTDLGSSRPMLTQAAT